MKPFRIWVRPQPNDWPDKLREIWTQRSEVHVIAQAELGVTHRQPREADGHPHRQKLRERHGAVLTPAPPEGANSANTLISDSGLQIGETTLLLSWFVRLGCELTR